jgi:hypothetical protein
MIEHKTFYLLKERKSGILSKGTNGNKYMYNSTGNFAKTFKENSTPPKLYNLGNAKSIRTQKLRYGVVLDIIPVTLVFDPENVLED